MFGERLKILRTEKKMLQKELAELMKVSPSTIGMYERGQRDPDTNTLKFLAEYFNVSVDYLLGRSDVKNPEHNKVITKAFHSVDMDGLPDEAIKQVEEYVEFIKLRYKQDKK